MKYCRAQEDKRTERRERIEQVIREREQQKLDIEQKKWSRKEEAAFAKTLLAYGVEYNKREKRFVFLLLYLHACSSRKTLKRKMPLRNMHRSGKAHLKNP